MQARPTLIRVKRKRNADAPDDLVVEVGTSKRQQTSLSSRLDGMSLSEQAQAAPPAPRSAPQRFTRLTTLSATEVSSLSKEQLSRLLHVQQQQHGGHRQQQGQQSPPEQQASQPNSDSSESAQAADNVRGATEQLPAAAGPSAAFYAAAAASEPVGATGVYQQVRQPRRGVTLFQATEAASDPLAGFARVYEVVRRDSTGQSGSSSSGGGPLGTGALGHQRRQRGGEPEVPSGAALQPAAWRRYAEGTLMCNQLPVVREAAAEALATHERVGGASGAQQQQGGSGVGGDSGGVGDGSQHAQSAGGGSLAVGAAGEADEAMDEDEYVYDLYAAAAADGESGEGAAGERERWMEMHKSGRAPVIQILDDDSWLVVETSDVEDSDADSEDSNAEGYFAHDYPDEASDISSSDDDEYDPEGAALGSRRGKRKDWWEESDGDGASSDDGSGGAGRKAQPRTYW